MLSFDIKTIKQASNKIMTETNFILSNIKNEETEQYFLKLN